MIPSDRLVLLAALPLLASVGWVLVPGALGATLALDALLLAAALLDAWRSGGGVAVEATHGPVQSVGKAFPVTLALRSADGIARRVRVADAAPGEVDGLPVDVDLPATGGVALTYRTTITGRGRHRFGPTAVRWRSPWGLWWRQVRLPSGPERAVDVYPDFTPLRQQGLRARQDELRQPVRARRRAGGESEFERLRPYVPGDPYRHVDWKATARRRAPITREYQQEANQSVILMIDAGRATTARFGALTAFDHALNAALALGHTALRHGDRVGLLVFDREVRAWIPPRGGVSSAGRLIRATYDVFPRLEEPDYAGAFGWMHARVRRRSLVVLITAVQDQVNADAATAVVRAMASRHLPVAVWLQDPRFEARVRTSASTPAEAFERAAAAELVGAREEALAAWRRRGALVVDAPPEALSSRLLSTYLEVKARRLL